MFSPKHWHPCDTEGCPHRTPCATAACSLVERSDPEGSHRLRLTLSTPQPCAVHRPLPPPPDGSRPDLEAMAARLVGVTPGPWQLEVMPESGGGLFYTLLTRDTQPQHPHSSRYMAQIYGFLGEHRSYEEDPETQVRHDLPAVQQTTRDATFLAHARTDLPALLAYVQRLEAERASWLAKLRTEYENLVLSWRRGAMSPPESSTLQSRLEFIWNLLPPEEQRNTEWAWRQGV